MSAAAELLSLAGELPSAEVLRRLRVFHAATRNTAALLPPGPRAHYLRYAEEDQGWAYIERGDWSQALRAVRMARIYALAASELREVDTEAAEIGAVFRDCMQRAEGALRGALTDVPF